MFILPAAELNGQEARTLVPPKLRALGLQVCQIIELMFLYSVKDVVFPRREEICGLVNLEAVVVVVAGCRVGWRKQAGKSNRRQIGGNSENHKSDCCLLIILLPT